MNKLIHIYIHTDKHTYTRRQRTHIKLRHTATHCIRNQHSATKGHEWLRRRQWTHIKTATHCNIQDTATKDLEWFRSTANKLATHKDLLHQSRQPQIWAMSHTSDMSHVTHMNHVMQCVAVCCSVSQIWAMSHTSDMSHVTHIRYEPCHTHESRHTHHSSFIHSSFMCHTHESRHTLSHVTHMNHVTRFNASCHKFEWVLSHI